MLVIVSKTVSGFWVRRGFKSLCDARLVVSLDKYAAVREKPSRYLMLPALHVSDDVAYTDSEFAVVDKEASSIRA